MTAKSLATRLAALAGSTAIGAAAAGVTIAAAAPMTAPEVQPVVFGVPLPLEPGPGIPAPDQLIGVLAGLADPGIPFGEKSGLVEGGFGPVEASVADRRMQRAVHGGKLPLSFDVVNIQPVGSRAVTADVIAAGPTTTAPPVNVKFVDQGGWKLSRSSMMTLMQMTSAG